MSAINTALPRISAATAIEMVDKGWKFEPLAINTRINVTRCSATKKKIVGGRMAKNSSFSFSSILCIGLLLSVQTGSLQKSTQCQYNESRVFLKIHSALDKGPIQVSLIGKAARDKVGPQPPPAGLQPEPPAYLKFEAAPKLIAPILA